MLFSKDKKIELKVTGMHCGHCKMACERAALSVNGVKKALADPKNNSLVLKVVKDFDANAIDEVIACIEECGFAAEAK